MKELDCDVLLELTQCCIVTITVAQVSVSHINNVHQFVSGVTTGPHFAAFTHSVHTYGHLQLSKTQKLILQRILSNWFGQVIISMDTRRACSTDLSKATFLIGQLGLN